MTRLSSHLGRVAAAICAAGVLTAHSASAADPEYRAQWVDAFHNGVLTKSQVTTTVKNLRDANSNVIIPEIRVYADAYYQPTASFYPNLGGTILSSGVPINCDLNSDPEPRKNSSYDALAETIRQSHDTSGGNARLDVWAWLVSFRSGAVMQAAHPEWLTQNGSGDPITTDFDPGHPGVQQQIYNVCMDIISHYDVDGLNFDYIRFTNQGYGYNPVSVARFNARYKRTGKPGNSDPLWTQWRRDQVTNVVRKIYLNTIARKPNVKLSGSLICFSPGPARPSAGDPNKTSTWKNSFQNTRPYYEVYQDWRSWMEEGILDISVPMAYLTNCSYPTAYGQWMDFIKENQFNRQGMIGPGTYLETLDDAITQLKQTRLPSTPAGKFSVGQALYSYASPYASSCGGNPPIISDPAGMSTALRTKAVPDPVNPGDPQPLYPTAAPVPELPRLTNGMGHLMGTVVDKTIAAPGWVDQAIVRLSAPGFTTRTMYTDGTGFYGFVDVPPGTYTLIVGGIPGQPVEQREVVITEHTVTTADVALPVYNIGDATRALYLSGGLFQSNAADMTRLDVDAEPGVSLEDAVRIMRRVADLDPNP
jgi:uncharacterized lipoprotein YddW (UPF0748 family)